MVDVLTNNVLGEFSTLGVRYTSQLNGAGSTEVAFPLDGRWAPRLLDDGLGLGRTWFFIVDETSPEPTVEWWGMAWEAACAPAGKLIKVACAGVQSVLERRNVNHALDFVNVDQAVIADALLAEAQNGTDRNLFLGASGQTTGVLRERHWKPLDQKRTGTLLQQLSQVENGFDYSFPALWDGGGTPPTKQMELRYPAPRTTPLKFLLARGNVSVASVTVSASSLATSVNATGHDIYANASAPIAGYPGYDASVNHSTVDSYATLQQWANRELGASNALRKAVSILVLVEPGEPIPIAPGMAVRLTETALAGDRDMIVSDMTVTQAGEGRQVSANLIEPAGITRTDESAAI